MPISPESLVATLNWRYATKSFDPSRKLSPEVLDALEQSLLLAPSSFGLQPWKFIIIEDSELRAQLLPQSWNQPQITHASHLVVLTARTDLTGDDIDTWIACLAKHQGKSEDALGVYKGMIQGTAQPLSQEERQQWNARQVYIALGQLMTSAAMMGVDSCPLEGISPAAYDEILHLNGSGYATVVACALGYRAESDAYAHAPKARFEKSQIITRL